MANFYGTGIDNIRQNFSRNSDRFLQGKHYFKLEGAELKEFKNSVTDSHTVKKGARTVNLWTERGAARHAKMLDTDQAWDIFEQLEDCYFHRKEILAKTHKLEREPLTNAVNMLVAKTKHLNFSDAYKLVHQRFNVKHIDEISFDAIPIAVEYVHHLIALYSNADKQGAASQDVIELMHEFVERVICCNDEMRNLCEAVRIIDSRAFMGYANQLVRSNEMARRIAWQFDFKNRFGEPLIDHSCRYITLSGGQRLTVKPNWFNCEA